MVSIEKIEYEVFENFVSWLYKNMLLRDPDPLGLKEKCVRLKKGSATLEGIVKEFVDSEEFASKSALFIKSTNKANYPFTNNVSQHDEIGLLIQHVVNNAFACKVVVDVGARGLRRSNSYDLMKFFNWRGVLVEANPNLIDSLKSDFLGLNVEIVECAVSDYKGRAKFTIGINDDVSSLVAENAASWGDVRGEISVEVKRLPDILDELKVPYDFGLLSIDIEGEDIKVLNDLANNSNYRPEYIMIEASYNFKTTRLTDLPFCKKITGEYVIIGQTAANLILKRVVAAT